MHIVLPLCLALLLPLSAAAVAPDFDPLLEEELRATPADQPLTALFFLSEAMPVRRLAATLDLERADRATRHRRIGLALRERAAQSQAEMRAALDAWTGPGEVHSYRPFWIVNAVSVSATPEAIRAIGARREVELASSNVPVELIRPLGSGPSDPAPGGLEYGLEQINAPALWAQGITGEGAIVCNLDTGVRGDHPAVADRWRASADGRPASECWFDAVKGRSSPYDDDGVSPTHGSHTMGTICGLDAATADTIGVAFGAHWVSGKIINSMGSGELEWILAGFEWAADPDGNPYTVDDVPHVISNSWGFLFPFCDDAVWDAIDAAEAMGAAVLFAAGNEGSLFHLRSPADRITTPLNAFAIGATAKNEQIAGFSSRGPSQCDHQTIKPEVAAPGVDVRSIRRDGYGELSGTSMACPHAAGAFALLRQVDADAPVDELKAALYLSARDKGAPGEDNTYGRGIIDVAAAARMLGQPSPVSIEVTGPAQVAPGDSASFHFVLTNETDEPQQPEVWFTATLPGGDEWADPEAVIRPILDPGATFEGDPVLRVPAAANDGSYLFQGKVGRFPFGKDASGFEVEVGE